MSDGPEKTLKMRKGWQEVAKCAGLDAYEAGEISRKVLEALKRDWLAEDLPRLIAILRGVLGDGRQVSLFEDSRLDQIEQLRSAAIGSHFGTVLVECTLQTLSEGFDGPQALHEAVKRALLDQALCGSRSIEGHFLIESGRASSMSIRDRLAAAIAACDFSGLTDHLLGVNKDTTETSPTKQTGLDEGPRLRPAPL